MCTISWFSATCFYLYVSGMYDHFCVNVCAYAKNKNSLTKIKRTQHSQFYWKLGNSLSDFDLPQTNTQHFNLQTSFNLLSGRINPTPQCKWRAGENPIWMSGSQNRIIMFCLPVPTLIYLWESYIFPGLVCLFCCRKICGPILGIDKSLTDTWMRKLGRRPCNSQKRNT